MTKIPIKSGGFVNLLEAGDEPIAGEVNFYAKELAWARKIGTSTNDPEAEKEFWRVTLEKKKADASYSVYQDFPEASGASPDPSLQACAPSGSNAPSQDTGRKSFVGAAICEEIINQLKPGKGESA